MRVIGIVLIIGGILMMIFRGVDFTQDKKIVDAGPIQITRKENKTIQWPLYAGGIAIAAGIIVLVTYRKTA